jgi:hypothetical protein
VPRGWRPRPKRRLPPSSLVEQLALLKVRSGGLCELWLPGCISWGSRVLYRHPPDSRRVRYQLAGMVHACVTCAAQARWRRLVDGLAVCHRQELTAAPLCYRRYLAHLDDAGGVHPLGPLYLPDSWVPDAPPGDGTTAS